MDSSRTADTDALTADLAMITLDCIDPAAMAVFYSGLLGWEQTYADGDYAMLKGPAHALGFGRTDDFLPPTWPDQGRKQFHLDLAVDDIETAAQRCVELGATLPDDQPGETWRVLLDPSGHPFCLTNRANWS